MILHWLKTRIIVYGATIDSVQVLYTAEDLTSQEINGIKEEIITDDTSYHIHKQKKLEILNLPMVLIHHRQVVVPD
ncbi:hypothetical protein CCP3SC5AM1_1750006 [Gammaproteobacteria bacterium]